MARVRIPIGGKIPFPSSMKVGVQSLALYLGYFYTAKIGLGLDAVSGYATLIWAPSGIALASLLLGGLRLWPAVFLAALAINITNGAPWLVAAGIALGNTGEAVCGAYTLQRFHLHRSMDRLLDFMLLVVFGAAVSSVVSATVGVFCLWAAGTHSFEGILPTWRAWWIGDSLGAFVVAPLILAWAHELRRRFFPWLKVLEGFSFLALLLLCTYCVLTMGTHIFWLFPFVVWGALRFSQLGATTSVFVISVMTVWCTSGGTGPFAGGSLRNSFILLDCFILIVGITALVLAASLAERADARHAAASEAARRGAILEGAMDCIINTDDQGLILEFNRAAERTFGYTRGEAMGQKISQLILLEERATKEPYSFSQYVSEGHGPAFEKRVEFICSRKDGSKFPAELSIARVPAEGASYFTAFLRDITEARSARAEHESGRQRLELQYRVMSAIAESRTLEEGLRKILRVITETLDWEFGAFWTVDESAHQLACRDTWVSPRASVAEFEAASRAWNFGYGEGLPGRVWATKKPAWINNVTLDTNFPRAKIAERNGLGGAFGFPILIHDQFIGVMEFFCRDVRDPDEDLLGAIAISGGQISQFLDRMNAEKSLRLAIAARDEFLSIASHELKTPLTSLRLQVQMTGRKINPATGEMPPIERLAHVFGVAERQVDRLKGLVDDLLDASRIQTGKFSFNFEAGDLSAVVADMADRFAPELQRAGNTVQLAIQAGVNGEFDFARLEQVMDNFLSNILKYAPRCPVAITLKEADGTVTLSVRDSGPGIPADKHASIFERFERANEDRGVSGLGLGLFIVREIASGHGGEVQLAGGPGIGTEFTLRFPLQRPA